MTGHRELLRVHWVDTDAGGRIHHTAAFGWAEIAEHALYRRLGVEGVGNLPRRHVEATYHAPLHFDDEFELLLVPERLGTSSITYRWIARRGETLCIEGRSVVVHVDAAGAPAPLPATLRSGIAALME